MTELTPQAVLKFYQERSPDEVTRQIEVMVDKLGVKDCLRLLAYQCAHLTMVSQQQTGGKTNTIDEADELLGPKGHA